MPFMSIWMASLRGTAKCVAILPFLLLGGASLLFAQDDPIPDTLDWRQYYPLQIGNAWEYVDDNFPIVAFPKYRYEEIVGDSVINDRTYFVLRELYYDTETESVDTLFTYRRYDESQQTVVELSTRDYSEHSFPFCSFAVAFPPAHEEHVVDCQGLDVVVAGGYTDRYLHIGPDSIHVSAEKVFCLGGACVEYNYGVGDVGGQSEGGYNVTKLRFLRIDGQEYGDGSVILSETTPALRNQNPGVSLYPNPARDWLRINLGGPFSVAHTISIYDILGRRIRTHMYEAGGAGEWQVDVRAWAPGAYVVRVMSERGELESRPFIIR